MKGSRRAAQNTPAHASRQGVDVLVVALGGLCGILAAVWSALTVLAARRVVTPSAAPPDTAVLAVDVPAQTMTLSRTPETVLPGRYGLVTSGTPPYLKVGTVLAQTERTVTRKLLTQVTARSQISSRARFSGWYHSRPAELHLPYRDVTVDTDVGDAPAWLFPAETDTGTWVIQVHGRGTTRSECLRAVPVLHGIGAAVLVISYRNDTEAPRSATGRYGLGASESHDVEAAIAYARSQGARRIILMGWSMGGAAVLQVALAGRDDDLLQGIILDSPVIAWRDVLDAQARSLRLPRTVTRMAMALLGGRWWRLLTGSTPIPFRELDVLARAQELRHPILILHSDDDTFVPSGASHRLAQRRPDIVRLEQFSGAHHTKLWNTDPARWEDAIRRWIADIGC